MDILKHPNRNYSASRIGQTILVTLALQCALAISAYAQVGTCIRPEPVCKVRSAVFAISAFDPLGSAARISDQHLVTSRHVIGAATVAELFLADGSTIKASVVPTDYTGDVVLLSAPDLPPGPDAAIGRGQHSVNAICCRCGYLQKTNSCLSAGQGHFPASEQRAIGPPSPFRAYATRQ